MLKFTDRALETIRAHLEDSDGELTALRVGSGGASPDTPSWELTLVADEEWSATDVEIDTDGVTVLVERDVAGILEGATIDYVEQDGEVGFQVHTVAPSSDDSAPLGSVAAHTSPAAGPGAEAPAGSPAAEGTEEERSPFGPSSAPHAPPPTEEERIEIPDPPEGPTADRVREILETRINPAVAMHGGHIGLADIRGSEIHIVMSGGCQGCALSRMTLKQGVERMIRQELPEVSAVHDVTDHAGGDNPYYEAPIG